MNKIPLMLSFVAAVVIAACCCSSIGGLLGGVEFTTGDFSDVPSYPGASQTTDTVPGIEGAMTVFKLIPGTSDWKHYTTTDSDDDILDWYEDTLGNYGWVTSDEYDSSQSENTLAFVKESGDQAIMLFVMIMPDPDDSDVNHIILGRIEIETEE